MIQWLELTTISKRSSSHFTLISLSSSCQKKLQPKRFSPEPSALTLGTSFDFTRVFNRRWGNLLTAALLPLMIAMIFTLLFFIFSRWTAFYITKEIYVHFFGLQCQQCPLQFVWDSSFQTTAANQPHCTPQCCVHQGLPRPYAQW